MYNLIVSGDCDAWKRKRFVLNGDRCVREYTTTDLVEKFCQLDNEAIEQLKRFPCLFAYEKQCGQAPRLGWFKSIKKRTNQVVLECEYMEVDPWIDENDLNANQTNFDIYGLELSRTHWAVKDVDLRKELEELNVLIPINSPNRMPTVNPEHHIFDVAFSFPGEARGYVEEVLHELMQHIDRKDIFYDYNYQAFLARPNLDKLLSKIYREQAKLIVVFLSEDYQRKPWPGLEFRSVRAIIFENQHDKVMYIRVDDSPVEGVLETDGYIDARTHSPHEIAHFINQRVQVYKERE